MTSISQKIAQELQVTEKQINAAIKLLDDGATVPFIARYRKEITEGLSDTHLRNLEERLSYLRELEARRETILKSIDEQGKLDQKLKNELLNADTKTRLEDLYLPYKPKRRTKAQIAREAGLAPLAEALYKDPSIDPDIEATKYLNKDKKIENISAALTGAKQILMENFSEDADLLEKLRNELQESGQIISKGIEDKQQEGKKFSDYFDHSEPLNKVPSHRALAMLRGRKAGFLQISVQHKNLDEANDPCLGLIALHTKISDQGRPADSWLKEVIRWTWKVKLHNQIESELLAQIKASSDEEAILVFAKNLKDLLMAAPAGGRAILGLDPGLRTGVKVAVTGKTGELLAYDTIYPHAPKKQWQQSIDKLAQHCKTHSVDLISIGNGTASRETDKLSADLIKQYPELKLKKIVVSEAGASIYSASEFAATEFPDLDVSIRGAVSIARRLLDPLAELVKIDAKSIGVGQYQHDVNQSRLARSLDAVVEDCVNAVGVDVNTASAPLMKRVAGLNQTIANNVVAFRSKNGPFKDREQLKQIPRFGAKTFEQSAGFLRITAGENPLDGSAVHPESYSIVENIAKHCDHPVGKLITNSTLLKTVDPAQFTTEEFGLITVQDILTELDKPGRDPRPEFKAPEFKEGIDNLKDLKPNMTLEGVITNVTNFGAFVDIGVHQDGLVHISALASKFVKDPREVVKTGDIVKVKVLEVDPERARIALTMVLTESAELKTDPNARKRPSPARNTSGNKSPQNNNRSNANRNQTSKGSTLPPGKTGTMADLFAEAKTLKKK
ncbi:MAG: RNA-binding transcriptional accessory protein [Gammaproteobacteria bacterium]|nr:RNA-binding transcriptional accessory protein [Gammaproteobacteria bacterium]